MKSCERRISQLHLLLDDELTSGQEEELNEHLQKCEICAGRMRELMQMKAVVEERLDAHIALPDDESITARATGATERHRKSRSVAGLMKKVLIGAAACVGVVILSAYLFVHFYFQRTFSHQLDNMVLRCSTGIEMASRDASWRPLRVGDRLRKSARIRTPAAARSFISFDGIRVLTDGEAELETGGRRTFSIVNGKMFVASADRDRPVTIGLGNASVWANGGVLRIERSEAAASMGVASGMAEITMPDGTSHKLIADQTAIFGKGSAGFEMVRGEVNDPFARMKVSAIERTRRRFEKIISKYLPNYRMTQHAMKRSWGAEIMEMWSRPDGMYQFASYSPGVSLRYVGMSGAGLGDYYDTLFVPSNRTISIGRQKLVPLDSGHMAAYPAWSHDGSMIAYSEHNPNWWPAVVKVAKLDDLEHPWVISQEYESVLPMFPLAWAPDDRHVLFMTTDNVEIKENGWWNWNGPYKIKIAPIDPAEGPVREFDSPFYDIPLELTLPLGKTISPQILKLPWGDALLCANWGNIGYIPIEQDGQSVAHAPGLFLTDFDPRELFVAFATWAPSGSKITFVATQNLEVHPVNVYILYDVEDILDGFAPAPRSVDDPRIKRVAQSENDQLPGGFSFDESLVFFQEDVNNVWRSTYPMSYGGSDFDLFYANALASEPGMPTQIHLPDTQVALKPSPEGNRIAYCNYEIGRKYRNYELRVVSFDIETEVDVDLGGFLMDNSGTNLIIPPGTLEENFSVKISTPFTIGEEAELTEGENTFFAMRLLDAKGLENPKFIEPMTLTIRYTDDEVEGLDEGMLEIYYYDESDPENPVWLALGGTVDPEHNEITVEIRHFSKFSVGGKKRE